MKTQINIKLTPSDQHLVKSIEEKYGEIKMTSLIRDALQSLEKNLIQETQWGNRFIKNKNKKETSKNEY